MNAIQFFIQKAFGDEPVYRATRPGHEPTRQKRQRVAPPHNHGVGQSKKSRKMAERSNRINRRRAGRNWRR